MKKSGFFFIILLLLLVIHELPFSILEGNEAVIMTDVQGFVTPSWLQNDWYVQQGIGYRYLFNFLAGAIAWFQPLYVVSLLGRLVGYSLFVLLIIRFFSILRISYIFAIPVLYLFILRQSLLAQEWIIGGIEAKVFAYLSVMSALYYILQGRIRIASVFAGLGLSFHILVGIYGLPALAVTHLYLQRKSLLENPTGELFSKKYLQSLGLLALAGGFGWYAIFGYLMENAHVDTKWAGYLLVVIRNPHHLYPGMVFQPGSHPLLPIAALIPTILAIAFHVSRVLKSDNEKIKAISLFSLFGFLYVILGFAFYASGKIHLLKYYLFRFPDSLPLLFAWILIAELLSKKISGWNQSGQALSVWGKRLAASVLILFSLNAFRNSFIKLEKFPLFQESNRKFPYYQTIGSDDLYQMTGWIQENTPPQSCFLINPTYAFFQIAAQRCQFVDFKHSPQSDLFIIQWYDRLMEITGGIKLTKLGFDNLADLNKMYQNLTANQAKAIMEKYNLQYYLTTDQGDLIGFTKLHQIGDQVIYQSK